VKVVEHSAKKYRADSKKGSPGWLQDVSDTNIRYRRAHAKRRMGNGYLLLQCHTFKIKAEKLSRRLAAKNVMYKVTEHAAFLIPNGYLTESHPATDHAPATER
jgi:hypothetical protein